jgi:hypothetical protein
MPPANLDALADRIAGARRDLESARRALAKDKAARAESLLGRLKDALSETPAEQAVSAAEQAVATAEREGYAAARSWVAEESTRLMASNAADAAAWSKQLKRHKDVSAREARIDRWVSLAVQARDLLASARSACESAAGMEVFDAVSTNKGLAVLSTLSTSEAKGKLRAASEAVKALAHALPRTASDAPIDGVDDTLDLVLDLALAPALDFLSFYNASKLSDAGRRCEEVHKDVEAVLAKLRPVAEKARGEVATVMGAMLEIELPYREAAAKRLPGILADLSPPGGNGAKEAAPE